METRELGHMLQALSDQARLRIVHYLSGRDGETTVSDLTKALHISQPLVSWHLRTLRRVQLVTTRRVGRQVLLSLNRVRLAACSKHLADWCERRTVTPQ